MNEKLGRARILRLGLRVVIDGLAAAVVVTHVQGGTLALVPVELMTLSDLLLFLAAGLLLTGAVVIWGYEVSGGLLVVAGSLLCIAACSAVAGGRFAADLTPLLVPLGLLAIWLGARDSQRSLIR